MYMRCTVVFSKTLTKDLVLDFFLFVFLCKYFFVFRFISKMIQLKGTIYWPVLPFTV